MGRSRSPASRGVIHQRGLRGWELQSLGALQVQQSWSLLHRGGSRRNQVVRAAGPPNDCPSWYKVPPPRLRHQYTDATCPSVWRHTLSANRTPHSSCSPRKPPPDGIIPPPGFVACRRLHALCPCRFSLHASRVPLRFTLRGRWDPFLLVFFFSFPSLGP